MTDFETQAADDQVCLESLTWPTARLAEIVELDLHQYVQKNGYQFSSTSDGADEMEEATPVQVQRWGGGGGLGCCGSGCCGRRGWRFPLSSRRVCSPDCGTAGGEQSSCGCWQGRRGFIPDNYRSFGGGCEWNAAGAAPMELFGRENHYAVFFGILLLATWSSSR